MAPLKSKTTRKTKTKVKARASGVSEPSSVVPLELQQLILNVFRDSFSERLGSDIQPLLQEVKGHLYNREFLKAFGRNDYLEAYAARWSPSRALGYLQVLIDLKEHLVPTSDLKEDTETVVCLGGGAGAEIAAFGGLSGFLHHSNTGEQPFRAFNVLAVDVADWSTIVNKLVPNITTAPPLSTYASASVQVANVPLVSPTKLSVGFQQRDVLTMDLPDMSLMVEGAKLVTILFTLNELYAASLSLTQRFLLNLTACLDKGAFLLVVDSPGSYSSVTLNGAEKKYPMQWLLDHTLLKQGEMGIEPAWAKIAEDESRWFRLPGELRYPIALEDMRVQLHLYKRVG